MKITIFYSWQSDIRSAANRTFIQQALEDAVEEIRMDESILVEPAIDRDTFTVPGAPDIDSTIFEKIDASTVMVSDVTIVNPGSGRLTPNPNVLIELGWGLRSLGFRRVILVQNTAFGRPEDLPFDLRQRRILTYSSSEDSQSRADERRALQKKLREALALILKDRSNYFPNQYPVELSINYDKKSLSPERHHYQLQVTLANNGIKSITEWHLDVEMPTRLIKTMSHAFRIPERSDSETTLFRATQSTHRDKIYPNDKNTLMTVDYQIDRAIYYDLRGLFDQKVKATLYVDTNLAAVAEKRVKELQCF